MDLTLTSGHFDLVYNAFSSVIASMGAASLSLLLNRSRILVPDDASKLIGG